MARPRLVYDDACGFCTWATEVAVRYGPFEPVGLSEVTATQRERLPDEYEACAHVLADGWTYSCGEAVEVALARIFPASTLVLSVLRLLPGYEAARERLYHAVSERRYSLERIVSSEPPVEV